MNNPFARSVGVPPSTTTMQLGGSLPCCGCGRAATYTTDTPDNVWSASRQQGGPAPGLGAAFPYGTPANMSGLGVVSEVDVQKSSDHYSHPASSAILLRNGKWRLLGIVDPMSAQKSSDHYSHVGTTTLHFNKDGSASLLGLTTPEIVRSLNGGALGVIPNDDELSVYRGGCYSPVQEGWVTGYRPDGSRYQQGGFYGADDGTAAANQMAAQALVDEALSIQRWQTILQAFSTLAIATIATISFLKK